MSVRWLIVGLNVVQLAAVILVLVTSSIAVDVAALVVIAAAMAIQVRELRRPG